VALAVGSTTLPHYRGLDAYRDALAPKILLLVDELVPPPADDADAFCARLRVSLPPVMSGRYRPLRVREDPEREALEVERALQDLGLAVAVLGLGPDGHVAMNQPGSGADTATRIVEITTANLGRMGAVAPATHALTLGMATLLRARELLLVVDGPGKRDALARVLDGPEGDDVPASLLRNHPHLTLLVRDPAA
jgi:glucosamine-6-phosphate deaminase